MQLKFLREVDISKDIMYEGKKRYIRQNILLFETLSHSHSLFPTQSREVLHYGTKIKNHPSTKRRSPVRTGCGSFSVMKKGLCFCFFVQNDI